MALSSRLGRMSRPQENPRSRAQRPAKTGERRWFLIAVTIVVVVGIVVAVVFLRGEGRSFDSLKGRWVRLDGYVLEIRAVDPQGKIDGMYLNPRPINIAKADEAKKKGWTVISMKNDWKKIFAFDK